MRVFSKRYSKAILTKKLRVSVSGTLRSRLWNFLGIHHFQIEKVSETNWHYSESIFDHVKKLLLFHYGGEELQALENLYSPQAKRVPVDLKGFINGAYPAQVLDVVELFYQESPSEIRSKFQPALNDLFEDERCPWRLVDGEFFRVDDSFLEEHVLSGAQRLMRSNGFSGALEEFEEARRCLLAGDTKEAIRNAALSLESTLKTVNEVSHGNASELIRNFCQNGFLEDIPSHMRNAIQEQVLMCLPTLGNRLGRHGQGKDVVEIPDEYAELSVALAGSFNVFLIRKSLKKKPALAAAEAPSGSNSSDDEIPF